MNTNRIGRQQNPKEGKVRTKDVVLNHCEEHIESQTPIASIIWFCQTAQSAAVAGFSHGRRTHRIALLDEALVVPAEGDEEEDSRDILKAVNPLPSLGFLTADVDHHQPLPRRTGHGEVHLVDAHSACAGENNILWVKGRGVRGAAENRVSIH